LSSEMLQYLLNHHSLYGLKTFLYFLLPEKLKTRLRINEKGYLNQEFVEKYQSNNSIAGNLFNSGSLHDALLDHFEYKLEHLLKWEDRNSMWFSLEARVPFLDYRLVEKTLATQGDLIIKNGMTKHLLRESMKGILPEKIRLRRDKVGFETPQDEWFKKPVWRSMISEILNSKSFAGRGMVNPKEAIDLFQSHISEKTNASKEIWKWIHLELWHREFIDA
jgi:asparagine synthase (glutamine-hydrolysing)